MKKRIISFVVGLVLLAVAAIGLFFGCEKNYTESYMQYKELKDVSTVSELRSYLGRNGIEYTIHDNRLTVNNLRDVSFVIFKDSCSIISANSMKVFESLDSPDFYSIKTEGVRKSNVIEERHYIMQNGIIYSKYLGEYKTQSVVLASFFGGLEGAGMALIIIALFYNREKKPKIKKIKRKIPQSEQVVEQT